MKSRRKRNVARKAKSNRIRTGSVSAPLHADPQSGFVPQNQYTPDSDFQYSSPEAGSPEPEALRAPASPPEASQSSAPKASAANSSPEAGIREPEAGIRFVSQNRANAQHSTGPRTPEGKAASAQNAFKHGLSIQRHAVLRDEDPAQYAQLLDELREIYEPRSRREDLSIEDVAQCRWALQRFDEAEAICLQELTDGLNDPEDFAGEPIISTGECLACAARVLTDSDDNGRRYIEPDTRYPTFDKIHRYRTHWERKHTRALAEFDRAQRARHAEANQARAESKEARAEAQAQRQAEAHALKQELALAREARQQKLHALRLATAKGKQPFSPENPNPATGDANDGPSEDAALAHLETLLSAPTPITEEEFLRRRAAQSANGFVSQNASSPNYGV